MARAKKSSNETTANLRFEARLGPANRSRDKVGQVYELFLSLLAPPEGKFGGQCFTPSHVVPGLIEMLTLHKRPLIDVPCEPAQ